MTLDGQDLLNELADQRNKALDRCVELAATVKALERERDGLKAQLDAAKPADPPVELSHG